MDNQNTLIVSAEQDIEESNSLLEGFVKDWKGEVSLETVESIKTLQLILQYRLDTQSALRQLSSIQNYLRQLLGIEASHSLEVNIERMEYALGNEDLHQILTMLNQLIDALLRIIDKSTRQHVIDSKKTLERRKNQKNLDSMIKVIEKQKAFVAKIRELKLSFENQVGASQPGIVLDHIAALQGPVSRFHQALQHGLILSYGLYKKIALHFSLNQPHEQQHFFKPMSTHLEERALAKRLGNFFNH